MKKYSSVEWRVYGKPVTQGSLSSFPYMKKGGGMGVRTPQSKNVLDWRVVIQKALMDEYPSINGTNPIFEKGIPVESWLYLYVAKPKSNKDTFPVNQRTGDIDKYARAVFDACTGYIYHDDSQVVSLQTNKVYVPEEEQGVRILFRLHEDYKDQ